MKTRVTMTLDPEVVQRAKTVAQLRQTNLSALVEDLLRQTTSGSVPAHGGFVERWAGKFEAREDPEDELLVALRRRHGLEE